MVLSKVFHVIKQKRIVSSGHTTTTFLKNKPPKHRGAMIKSLSGDSLTVTTSPVGFATGKSAGYGWVND